MSSLLSDMLLKGLAGRSGPSLNFNFVDESAFSPQITFTRASTATFFNSSGVLTSAAIDAPRLDYDPSTLTARGLLIEEQRTNSIRNNTMQGAVAGTPGTLPTNWTFLVTTTTGLTSQVVGTGVESGISYVDMKLSGTAVGAGSLLIAFDANTQTVAVQNQVWTLSVYRRLIAGSFAGLTSTTSNLFLNSYTAAGAFDAASTSQVRNEAVPTNNPLNTQLATLTGTLSSATTARVNGGMFFSIANGAAIDITLRIGLPQLEQGAFATSVIPTTTTALTRSADVALVNTLSPWFNASEGVLFSESQQAQNSTAGFPVPVGLSGALGGVDCIEHIWNNSTSTLAGNVVASSSVQANIGASGLSRTAIQKFALSYKANDFAACVGGGAVATDTSGTIPVVDRLVLGARPSSALILNGWIRRITYYPRRLTDDQLQQITA